MSWEKAVLVRLYDYGSVVVTRRNEIFDMSDLVACSR